ncbi:MAG: glycoside hydrolase family 26 protein [Oscillospiraceae bacterium]|nr:glycoside hydrolase family 26 protein [Oscillospiraceae bacterium]
MKNLFVVLMLVFVLGLSGCSDISYPPRGSGIAEAGDGETGLDNRAGFESITEKYRLKKFDITEKSFDWTHEFEPEQGHWVFENGDWSVDVKFNSPQHYCIGINAVALSGNPVVVLSVGEKVDDESDDDGGELTELGAFYITGGDSYFIEPVYFSEGEKRLTFTVFRGNVRFDKVSVVNTVAVSPERFRTSVSLSHPTPSAEAVSLFEYLNRQFGSRVLSSQFCTVNTNAEIEAVYAATGRYPVVRFGDLSLLTVDARYNDDEVEVSGGGERFGEIELGRQWHNRGGIVAYTWTWDGTHREDGFALSEVVGALENSGVVMLSDEFIVSMVESGEISDSSLRLIRDIDEVAEAFSSLASDGIPILFNPLPDGGSRLNWWGRAGGEVYVRLWRILYDRLADYHGLDNIIWIWSGGSYQYYPGDNRVDIIGESAFADGDVGSQAVKMSYTALYNSDGHSQNRNQRLKPAVITGSSGLPSPDVMARDNACWLIWTLYRGDFVIDAQGAVLPDAKSMLDSFYNHELTVCLDNM